ncbi:uncharacterized protein METZ01_LOCUS331246, partial [marine metagenome]
MQMAGVLPAIFFSFAHKRLLPAWGMASL